MANLLIKKSDWKIAVAGHTDNVGSAKTNLILSKKRSQAVADYLEQRGVNSSRVFVQYFGEENQLPITKQKKEDSKTEELK